jgi:hypothetical protein
MPLLIKTGGTSPAGPTGPTGPAGAAALANGLIWTSAATPSAHGNGVSYLPLAPSVTTSVQTQTRAVAAGRLRPGLRYRMAGAGGGNVVLRVDWHQWVDGGDSTAALTTGTPVTVAMAADVNSHTLDYGTLPDLDFLLAAGDGLFIKVSRIGGGSDNHASNMEIEVIG